MTDESPSAEALELADKILNSPWDGQPQLPQAARLIDAALAEPRGDYGHVCWEKCPAAPDFRDIEIHVPTLKLACAAICDGCAREFGFFLRYGPNPDYSSWRTYEEADWYHGEGTEDCEANVIRTDLDPMGSLLDGAVLNRECSDCHEWYREREGDPPHECDA